MDVETIEAHAHKGADWLLAQQSRTGRWRSVEHQQIDAYYKAPWAFARTGHYDAAHRCLNFVDDALVTEAGDLAPRGNESFTDGCPLYPNVYVVIGSTVTGRYELARPLSNFLRSRQHPVSGGFYSQREALGADSETNVYNSSASGIACLAAGELEAARRAGEYLRRVVNAQPTDERFYTTLDAAGELVTDLEEADRWMGVVDPSVPDQYWGAHMGLPFVLLTQLASATGEDRYRELADWFFAFQERGVDPWSVSSSGKMAWGTSMRYRQTGDESDRELALRIAEDVIVDQQRSDGRWDLYGSNPYGDTDDPEGYSVIEFDITAEFTLWLAIVAANLRVAE